jgi:hypothetical protein
LAKLDYALLLEREPVADAQLFHLPADVPPWTDTGLVLEAGAPVTLLADGEIEWAPGSGLRAGPGLHLWARIGETGEIFNLPRSTRTATPVEAYALQKGGIDVAVLRWRCAPLQGLDALCAAAPGDALLAAERERLRSPIERPRGWDYLWFLGERDIFSSVGRSIRVDARSEVGILQKRAEIPLDEQTRLCWRWRMDELPSAVAEDTMPTHDYVSIAVEFENGLDLTWYWSAALPSETHYTCPLPTWAARETHMVIRSGADGLGEWHEESRPVLADYRRAIDGAGEGPRRVVAVWLIAVSLFQQGRALAEFADIELRRGDECIRVT